MVSNIYNFSYLFFLLNYNSIILKTEKDYNNKIINKCINSGKHHTNDKKNLKKINLINRFFFKIINVIFFLFSISYINLHIK